MKKRDTFLALLRCVFLVYALSNPSFASSLNWPKILKESNGNLEALEGGYTNEAFILMALLQKIHLL